jgi:hypothetical protein
MAQDDTINGSRFLTNDVPYYKKDELNKIKKIDFNRMIDRTPTVTA